MRQTGDSSQPDEAERTRRKHSEKRELKVVGIDLARNNFHVHGVDASGGKVVGKKLSRQKLTAKGDRSIGTLIAMALLPFRRGRD